MRRAEKKRLKEEMKKNHLWPEFIRIREQLKRDGVSPDKRWTQAAVSLGVINEVESAWTLSISHLESPFHLTRAPLD